jgi:hypothetical protein
MKPIQTRKNVDVSAILAQSLSGIISEIRADNYSMGGRFALHILFVVMIVLGKKSARDMRALSDNELEADFESIKKTLESYSALSSLLRETERFGVYQRFFDQLADDWNRIAKRAMVAADPEVERIIDIYGIEAAANAFFDVRETLNMLDTPEWDEAFGYLAAN